MKAALVQFFLLIKNSTIANQAVVRVVYKKNFINSLEFLYKEGFIQSFSLDKNTKQIYMYIKSANQSNFAKLKIISKPSNNLFLNYAQLCQITEKTNTFLVSTTQGLMTIKGCKKTRAGGKLLLTF